jgi:hypothetical protein
MVKTIAMNRFIKNNICTAGMILISTFVNAQEYENIFSAGYANLLQVQGPSRIEHSLKGATVLFPNGSGELDVSINIPSGAIENKTIGDTDLEKENYQFWLTLPINANEIQEELTSHKTFTAYGLLKLNNITKQVSVSYTPVVSGTEENGNFNIYMSIQFNPVDFSLATNNIKTEFLLNINNAKVNRV